MLENLIQNYFKTQESKDVINIVRFLRCNGLHHLGQLIGEYFQSKFPKVVDLNDELGIMQYYAGNYEKSYQTYKKLLKLKNLNTDITNRVIFNQHFSIDKIANNYIHYPEKKIANILNKSKNDFPRITFSITSCKRFNLFTQTVNSFINCCKDFLLIDDWICVDDNSSPEDRVKMKKMYPFFNFYFKNTDEKGHPQSMNIIQRLTKSPFLFHLEDDWKFFEVRNYLTQCLEVLYTNDNIGQCLINKNYAETSNDIDIVGGEFRETEDGLRFYIHEYVNTDEKRQEFIRKHGSFTKSCNYWPHFSFRPSLIRTKIFEAVGEFNENISHFEMDYSSRYVNNGYISAFLEGIYSIHIGRLTSERNDKTKPNAYELNNEAQFSGKEQIVEQKQVIDKLKELDFPFKFKTKIVNLDNRTDRWENMVKKEELSNLNCERFSAIEGSKLVSTHQLQRIFEGNDYNMREGMVGCALSHIKLFIELLQDGKYDHYLILEDDIEFTDDFEAKFKLCCKQLTTTDWDLFYLGHHIWEHFKNNEVHSKTILPKIEQFNRMESLRRSMGGTIGYLINKKGAQKFLNFINENGMTNGIDTMQQKSADILNIFYAYPHIIFSECYRTDNVKIDTDIQYNYNSLSMRDKDALKLLENLESKDDIYYYETSSLNETLEIMKCSPFDCFKIGEKIVVFSPTQNNHLYIDRLKKNGRWSITQAIQYK